MIFISFNLTNPFSNKFDNVVCKQGRITKYKNYEFEVLRDTGIISFSLHFNPYGDHGGLSIAFGLLSWDISFRIYDSRHWNQLKNTWTSYDDEENIQKRN